MDQEATASPTLTGSGTVASNAAVTTAATTASNKSVGQVRALVRNDRASRPAQFHYDKDGKAEIFINYTLDGLTVDGLVSSATFGATVRRSVEMPILERVPVASLHAETSPSSVPQGSRLSSGKTTKPPRGTPMPMVTRPVALPPPRRAATTSAGKKTATQATTSSSSNSSSAQSSPPSSPGGDPTSSTVRAASTPSPWDIAPLSTKETLSESALEAQLAKVRCRKTFFRNVDRIRAEIRDHEMCATKRRIRCGNTVHFVQPVPAASVPAILRRVMMEHGCVDWRGQNEEILYFTKDKVAFRVVFANSKEAHGDADAPVDTLMRQRSAFKDVLGAGGHQYDAWNRLVGQFMKMGGDPESLSTGKGGVKKRARPASAASVANGRVVVQFMAMLGDPASRSAVAGGENEKALVSRASPSTSAAAADKNATATVVKRGAAGAPSRRFRTVIVEEQISRLMLMHSMMSNVPSGAPAAPSADGTSPVDQPNVSVPVSPAQ